jgi:type II secretory pathway pseudopilin PulG
MNTALQSNSSAARPAAAFTLIELILAISVMSMVLSGMVSVLYISYNLQKHVNESLDQTLPVEDALLTIQHDLANLICNNSSTNGGLLIGCFQSINQTNVLPSQVGPDFYTTGGQLDGLVPFGDVEKIDFLLTPPTNRLSAGKDLVRAVTRNLLSVNQMPQPESKRTLLSGVQDVVFSYWNGTSWENSWDSTQQTNLPYAINMKIIMAAQRDGRATPSSYELVIPVDIQMSTNLTNPLP